MNNATVSIESVNPDVGAGWLAEKLPDQRPLRKSHRDKLKQEMLAGSFALSSDAIVLVSGKLANGQHRLSALVESKTTQPFMVLRTDDENIYKIIDAGLKRTVGDVMGIAYAGKISAIANWVLDYRAGNFTASARVRKTVISRSQQISFATSHAEEISQHVSFVTHLQYSNNVMTVTMAGGFLMLVPSERLEQGKQFLELVFKGSKDDPAFDLRERLIKNRISKSKLPPTYVFALVIKAFKSQINGTRPGVLKMHDDEEYPKMEGL